MDINCLLFDDFETLDLFGPVEVFGKMEGCETRYFSMNGGIMTSKQNARIMTENMDDIERNDILIVPGGKGTRKLVDEHDFMQKLKRTAEKSSWCLTVCTGSALLARTGLLDGFRATSNKMAFEWARSNGKNVNWQYRARWVADGKYYTSSGISAGIDMSLGFILDRFGEEKAREIARTMEYKWENNRDDDFFAT